VSGEKVDVGTSTSRAVGPRRRLGEKLETGDGWGETACATAKERASARGSGRSVGCEGGMLTRRGRRVASTEPHMGERANE
jgi:hypothetical protein